MKGFRRGLGLVGLMVAATGGGVKAQVLTTLVSDTVYRADGTAAGGTVVVSWGAFTTAGGQAVPAGTTTVSIGAGGVLHVALAPNAGSVPVGNFYTAVYHLNDGTVSREFWVVPVAVAGGGPARLAGIRNQVLPLSVAMQTVTKAYVDAKVAEAKVAEASAGSTFAVVTAGQVAPTGASFTLGVDGGSGSELMFETGANEYAAMRHMASIGGMYGGLTGSVFQSVNRNSTSEGYFGVESTKLFLNIASGPGASVCVGYGNNGCTDALGVAGSVGVTGSLGVSGAVRVGQLVGGGAAPGVTAGAAAGSSAGVSVSGTSVAGVVSVTVGAGPAAGAVLASVSFAGALGAAPQGCALMPRTASAAGADVYTTAPTTSGWAIAVGASALVSGATYAWSYSCL